MSKSCALGLKVRTGSGRDWVFVRVGAGVDDGSIFNAENAENAEQVCGCKIRPDFSWDDIETVMLDMDGTLLDKHFDDYFVFTLKIR